MTNGLGCRKRQTNTFQGLARLIHNVAYENVFIFRNATDVRKKHAQRTHTMSIEEFIFYFSLRSFSYLRLYSYACNASVFSILMTQFFRALHTRVDVYEKKINYSNMTERTWARCLLRMVSIYRLSESSKARNHEKKIIIFLSNITIIGKWKCSNSNANGLYVSPHFQYSGTRTHHAFFVHFFFLQTQRS